MKKVLVSGFAFPHHTRYGGYDKAGKNPDVTCITSETMPFSRFFALFRYKSIGLFFLDIYARILLAVKYDILHYIYTENQFFFPFLFKGKKKIIGTVHLDPVSVEESRSIKMRKSYLRCIRGFDMIITLSSEAAKIFSSRYRVKTAFIPHGFSLPEFSKIICADEKSNCINRQKINIFFAGFNYRKYDVLYQIIENTRNMDIHFHAVGQRAEEKKRLALYKNVSVYGRLSDDEYFSLLDDCDYHFLPLAFATANNALLEAQALGITGILPAIGGILDYAAPAPLNIFYHNTVQALAIFDGLKKQEHNTGIAAFSRQFEWNEIYKRLNALYESLC